MEHEIKKDVEKKSGLSKGELQKLLERWQKKLFLTEWDLKIQIVDFLRKDFRQSGNFVADLDKKTGVIQLSCNPFRDEEYILVHEMMHVVVWSLDSYAENAILKNHKEGDKVHGWYLEHLERMVDKLTAIALGREEKKYA
ncbi:hypothetical protein A3A71_01175 [Candidatus Berkelbacteria bacterium RIFCSPLOWO2_01_FULL_50_28]|uniref:SprT-like domain-containing protein n=1 Tax=Candidatus Berkelbacteria bacterium RIFCSPLOWO2_01_FULL_50_28 TaxID=1797471 RepID=A0A1F5EB64_9BACT|nr:MAG: hypothetical protein A2807_01745 [Candidatus Berkelbacteria bacterium RIFCSPHIGHO2_01_FULL_50_36]OGD63481.1 MAG: hypothetical protein A3F39_03290 [Candidatus Berkelbacteria bacterium RIFCSPHIGHO2_12_FULL_50_11]OGD64649.1 MAG: hypothetical protein A3A71_01175 [Candidatus Berkelbacteria bacterium RIFCSPLOWO2_01_FULL_50_28]